MNKILKSLFLLTMVVITFTSCRDDAELADPGKPGNPQSEVVGTYNGTWAVTLDGVTTEYEGTITIEATSQYVGKMHVTCPGRKLDAEVAVNIMKQSSDYRFYNEIPDNPVGAAFSGAITPGGKISMNFQKIEREGRKSYVFQYVFDGNR